MALKVQLHSPVETLGSQKGLVHPNDLGTLAVDGLSSKQTSSRCEKA
jgi:hypothetical protein